MNGCFVRTIEEDGKPGRIVNLIHATAIDSDGSCAYFDLFTCNGAYDIVSADRAKALRFALNMETEEFYVPTDPDEYLKREV